MKLSLNPGIRSLCRTSARTLAIAIALSLTSCASNSKKDDEALPIKQEDYPTLATVEYVIECMNRKGSQNYINLYQCTCQFDKLAEQLTYVEYNQAVVFRNLRSMPGENGSVFRDPPQAKILRNKLKNARILAEQQCEGSNKAASK
jgi:hypothetical protein